MTADNTRKDIEYRIQAGKRPYTAVRKTLWSRSLRRRTTLTIMYKSFIRSVVLYELETVTLRTECLYRVCAVGAEDDFWWCTNCERKMAETCESRTCALLEGVSRRLGNWWQVVQDQVVWEMTAWKNTSHSFWWRRRSLPIFLDSRFFVRFVLCQLPYHRIKILVISKLEGS